MKKKIADLTDLVAKPAFEIRAEDVIYRKRFLGQRRRFTY